MGTRAEAATYVQLDIEGELFGGVASSHDTVTAMLRATVAAFNASTVEFGTTIPPKPAARKSAGKADKATAN